jgi:hypothetical protein
MHDFFPDIYSYEGRVTTIRRAPSFHYSENEGPCLPLKAQALDPFKT